MEQQVQESSATTSQQPSARQKKAALEAFPKTSREQLIWIEDDYGAYGMFSCCVLLNDEPGDITRAGHHFGRQLHAAAGSDDRILIVEHGDIMHGYVMNATGDFRYVHGYSHDKAIGLHVGGYGGH